MDGVCVSVMPWNTINKIKNAFGAFLIPENSLNKTPILQQEI